MNLNAHQAHSKTIPHQITRFVQPVVFLAKTANKVKQNAHPAKLITSTTIHKILALKHVLQVHFKSIFSVMIVISMSPIALNVLT